MSATLKAKEFVTRCRQEGRHVMDGGLGESPVGVPAFLETRLVEAIPKSWKYTPCHGSANMQALLGTKQLITGNALKEVLCMIQLAFCKLHPDGVVVFLVPHWPTYAEQAKTFNLSYHTIMPKDQVAYKITKQDLLGDPVLAKHPHLIFFNNPCNPSGSVYTVDELKDLAKGFSALKSVVLADNIYAELAYDGMVPSVSDFYPRVIDATSLSKTLGCGGWRYGWARFPDELSQLWKQTQAMASQMYTCPTAPLASLAEYMIAQPKELETHLIMVRSMLSSVFDQIIEPHLSTTKIKFTKTQGAWYTLLDFQAYAFELAQKGVSTSASLADVLMHDFAVVMVPGSEFGFAKDQLILRYSFVDLDVNLNGILSWDAKRITKLCMVLVAFCQNLILN